MQGKRGGELGGAKGCSDTRHPPDIFVEGVYPIKKLVLTDDCGDIQMNEFVFNMNHNYIYILIARLRGAQKRKKNKLCECIFECIFPVVR